MRKVGGENGKRRSKKGDNGVKKRSSTCQSMMGNGRSEEEAKPARNPPCTPQLTLPQLSTQRDMK
jgi:hypothetical protein